MGFPIPGPHTRSTPCSQARGGLPQADRHRSPPPRQPRRRSTHGIEEHGEEELAPVDDLVQLAGATRVLAVEDGVCEEAAGLPREDLGMGTERSSGTSRHGWRREDPS